jgi:SagB-type dehydrogenase family enzyme
MKSGGWAAARIRLWSLSEDVLVEGDPDSDRLVVVTRWGEMQVDGVDETVRESLRRMSLGPISLANVMPPDSSAAAGTHAADHPHREWALLRRVLARLSGSVVHSLGMNDGDGPLLSAIPVTRKASFHVADISPTRPVRLSRFAAMRAEDGELTLESPLANYRVALHRQEAARVVVALATQTAITEMAPILRVPQGVVADIVSFLAATGTVVIGEETAEQDRGISPSARFAEDRDPSLIRWSHHDLLFHSRSRMGRYGGPSGAVFPHADVLPSPPLVRPIPPGPRFVLYRPTLADVAATDPPLTEVIESARLCPELSARPLTADQIGELLFRTARIRSVSPASAGAEVTYTVSDRPYLGIFGLHELELYVTLHSCEGLPRATYHYDPQGHALTLVNDTETELDELLDIARVAAGTTRRPPALITITARVARSSWMYGGIAYSLALTHVGALQQTLLLVATAMGLAGCVPAVDPGDVTDSVLRLDWPAESGVGEFIVGYQRGVGRAPNIGL